MKLHSKSCLLDAFAFIMNMPPHIVATQVGHNGPNGFHTQELIEVALRHDFSVTMIERTPVSQNPDDYSIEGVDFKGGTEERFIRQLERSHGVLLGVTPWTAKPHAIAWTGMEAYDPGIEARYPMIDDEGQIMDSLFVPHAYLRLDMIV